MNTTILSVTIRFMLPSRLRPRLQMEYCAKIGPLGLMFEKNVELEWHKSVPKRPFSIRTSKCTYSPYP